jgi:hypothetical protein
MIAKPWWNSDKKFVLDCAITENSRPDPNGLLTAIKREKRNARRDDLKAF